jgi:hypothetical protein
VSCLNACIYRVEGFVSYDVESRLSLMIIFPPHTASELYPIVP